MTSNSPTPNATPIRRSGSIDVLGTISSLLAGYSGGITIVRELVQNTDDVPGDGERWLQLHFHPDRLVVRNNTTFREVDFDNIMRIARGGKKQEQRRTIGAFGVGFVSVYQLTDTPIIRSADRELHMMPGLDDFPIDEYACNHIDYTEFVLPYRRKPTKVGERLGMPHVTDAWVTEIMHDLPDETYRLLFFLRRLSRITVFEHDQLVSDVRREVVSDTAGWDRITITSRRRNSASLTHTWLRFKGQVPGNAPLRSDGQPDKDRSVHIVVPDSDVPDAFLREHQSGRLYNYLPTEIVTGLPFQINGDFYPTTDRKGINTSDPHSKGWNDRVLAAIGSCAATALPKLLTHFTDTPLQLYQRIDTGIASELVAPISTAIITAARSLALFKTSDGWRDRIDTRWIKSELRAIGEKMSPALMLRDLQDAAWPLLKQLDVREFTFADMLAVIRREVQGGTALVDAPPYLRSISQIESLYAALDSGLAQGLEVLVAQTPIFLDHTGRLWSSDRCVRNAQEELRKELAESGLHFWLFNPERYRVAASMVDLFKLKHLWEALRVQLPREMALSDAPEWLNTQAKLYRLYRTIIRTREPVLKSDIVRLPICLSRDMHLYRPDRLLLPNGAPILYEILAEDQGANLVAQPIYAEKPFRELYIDLGVPLFATDHLFSRLDKLARDETALTNAHSCLNSREKLLRLYRYLRDNRTELESKHIETLRHRLPIWLCRDGFLRCAKERSLPPDMTNLPTFIRADHVLDLDGSEMLRTFLAEVVQLRPLGIDQFIIQALIPQFASLERTLQVEALRFIRISIGVVRDNEALRDLLKQAPLIYGDNDQLHRPIDLCFPRASCRILFPDRFHEPHHGYYAAPTAGDYSNWIWYDLFKLLGVNHLAPPTVILEEMRRITARPPRQGREQIEKIFRYLEEHWESYQTTSLPRTLRSERWLPADGDETRWYRPNELYQRQDKPLVSHVAPVLGFSEARRPKATIADTLGFPASVPVAQMVKQLLALSSCGEPATAYLYQTLSRSTVSDDELKPLRGRAVIYVNDSGKYWKPDHIFLSNQQAQFGRYRGYLSGGELHTLFHRLGAREMPIAQDYVDLLREISHIYRDDVPAIEAKLVRNAYEQLAHADAAILLPLRSLPCVLTTWHRNESETFALRLPESVVLTPAEEYRRLLPELPIALYTTLGEPTLQVLGVRTIEQVLTIEHLLQPNLSDPVDLARYFAQLARPMKRLLFHHNRNSEHDFSTVAQRLGRLQGYWQDGIQVVYRIRLGQESYASQPTKRQIFHLAKDGHVYLDRRLTEITLPRELARVLGDVLDLRDGYHSLLKELIADPRGAQVILDDNHIKQLPQELDLTATEEEIEDIIIGTQQVDLPVDVLSPSALPSSSTGVEVKQHFVDDVFTDDSQKGREASRTGVISNSGTIPTTNGASSSRDHNDTDVRRVIGSNGTTSRSSGGAKHTASRNGSKILSTDSGGSGTKSSLLLSQPPRPQPDPAGPTFTGTTVSSSPAIPTDYDGLRDRVRRWAEATGQSLTAPAATSLAPPRTTRPIRSSFTEEHNIARFVLSFPEMRDGFLRLTTSYARGLFQGSPPRVECHTDAGTTFPLWLDWRRDIPIAYNQEALGAFFSDEAIPAGGIVYLQREHDETFRLYYNIVPHTVPAVRIATNEQGEVCYETFDDEVVCETDDAIYRSERRFEDQAALWLEAAGKKSVEETLCDMLMSAPHGWLHEDELKAMVASVRMVADSTVAQTLRAKAFFEHDEQGNWSLNPVKVLEYARNDVVARWHRATTKLLGCNDEVLGDATGVLRPPLNELTGRLIRIEAALTPHISIDSDELALIQQLNNDPSNYLLGTSVTHAIQQRASAVDVDPALDTRLRAVLAAASDAVWTTTLRTALRDLLVRLRQAHDYQRVLAVARSWSNYDPYHGLDLAEVESEAHAVQLIAGSQPTLEAVLQAIALAPTLALAREKLHLATQAALRQHEPTLFLAHGTDERAVDAFFNHVATIIVARPKLDREKVPAFDRTVLEEARRLWVYVSKSAQIRLLLWLPRYIDPKSISLTNSELQLLVDEVEHHSGERAGLLIGSIAWKFCSGGHTLQQPLANQLARCHIKMGIWEKANNRPWKQHVSESLRQELHKGWQQNSTTLIGRERCLLDLLRTTDVSPLGVTLEDERAKLYHIYEREYQQLLESAA